MLELLKSLIFGIVEGITEWLPVSSTGHMILLDKVISLSVQPDADKFLEMYLVVIQLGAILAVVLLFWNQLWPFTTPKQGWIKKDIFSMWIKIVVACIPAVIVELCFGDQLEELFYNYITVSVMLILFGILFIVVENWNKTRKSKINTIAEISYQTAFLIGMFQLIAAVFPGTSRSGATIIGGLILGLSRTIAAEFTFYLAVPVMFGASFIKILKFGFQFTPLQAAVLAVGMISAFLVSVFVIRFLLGYIKQHDFKVFGWYRIALGILVLGIFSLVF
jgi:undecaprenyl-diphosphatase